MGMRLAALAAIVFLFGALGVAAQGTGVSFGGGDHDSSAPVEVSANQMEVDQAAGTARFTGNVVIGQDKMRLTGAVVDVTYGTQGNGQIEQVHATGGVTLATPEEAAEAKEAVYTVGRGTVVLTGDVVMTQGSSAISGDKLTVQLDDGTGIVEGRVRVIFQPAANQ